MANVIQRYFYVALKLNPANPERYLSTRDFDYFHKKFFAAAGIPLLKYSLMDFNLIDYVTSKHFESFWLYFGKALQALRSNSMSVLFFDAIRILTVQGKSTNCGSKVSFTHSWARTRLTTTSSIARPELS
jgi:hypothetical protein